jgi:hypothetical protein
MLVFKSMTCAATIPFGIEMKPMMDKGQAGVAPRQAAPSCFRIVDPLCHKQTSTPRSQISFWALPFLAIRR